MATDCRPPHIGPSLAYSYRRQWQTGSFSYVGEGIAGDELVVPGIFIGFGNAGPRQNVVELAAQEQVPGFVHSVGGIRDPIFPSRQCWQAFGFVRQNLVLSVQPFHIGLRGHGARTVLNQQQVTGIYGKFLANFGVMSLNSWSDEANTTLNAPSGWFKLPMAFLTSRSWEHRLRHLPRNSGNRRKNRIFSGYRPIVRPNTLPGRAVRAHAPYNRWHSSAATMPLPSGPFQTPTLKGMPAAEFQDSFCVEKTQQAAMVQMLAHWPKKPKQSGNM